MILIAESPSRRTEYRRYLGNAGLQEPGRARDERGRAVLLDWGPGEPITEILNGRRAVPGDTALRPGRVFGTPGEIRMNLQ